MSRYWKCIRTSYKSAFKVGKIYETNAEGTDFETECGFYYTEKRIIYKLYGASFEEVSKDDWMEQEYKAYYEEEARMNNNRYWKCVSTEYYGFKEGNTYVTDQDKKNYTLFFKNLALARKIGSLLPTLEEGESFSKQKSFNV